jgi:hypothetical protein
MNYDTTNLDLLSIDTKKLDVCNDAKYVLDYKLQNLQRFACFVNILWHYTKDCMML